MAEIVVLLSAGRHPATGRPRPADSDSRALQLAHLLGAQGHSITALHAGPDDEPLRVYAGFGPIRLVRLDVGTGTDMLPVLAHWLTEHAPALVLMGGHAERGPGAGLLPYALAKALGGICLPDIAGIESLDDRATVIQALEGGRRRRLAVPLPAVVTAAHAAAIPPGWAYARAARAVVEVEQVEEQPAEQVSWRTEPARALAKPVKKIRGGAAARMAAATSFTVGKGKLMIQPDPGAAAQAIVDYLTTEGILRR